MDWITLLPHAKVVEAAAVFAAVLGSGGASLAVGYSLGLSLSRMNWSAAHRAPAKRGPRANEVARRAHRSLHGLRKTA